MRIPDYPQDEFETMTGGNVVRTIVISLAAMITLLPIAVAAFWIGMDRAHTIQLADQERFVAAPRTASLEAGQ